MNVPPSRKAKVYVASSFEETFRKGAQFVARLAYASEVEVGEAFSIPGAVTIVTADAKVYIPMDELVDKKAELKRLNKEMTKEVKAISGEVMELFQRYDWPGNVRELNNVLEHAMNLCDGDTLELKHFDRLFAQALRKNLEIDFSAESPLERIRDNAEREAICKALELTQNNRSMAARLLKISRMSLYNKMRKYEIS